jgi:hypothetical protein
MGATMAFLMPFAITLRKSACRAGDLLFGTTGRQADVEGGSISNARGYSQAFASFLTVNAVP